MSPRRVATWAVASLQLALAANVTNDEVIWAADARTGKKSVFGSLRRVSRERVRVLCGDEVIYTLDLPVLNFSNSDHVAWKRYVQYVYASNFTAGDIVDLNTFSWFYWFAPIRLRGIYFADWWDGRPEVPFGTPWTGNTKLRAWNGVPENLLRAVGFFVHRQPWSSAQFASATRLEVMRSGPNPFLERSETEKGLAWFYHAVGSGIFVSKIGGFDRIHESFKEFKKTPSYPAAVYNARNKSVPRIELVFNIGKRENDTFWPARLTNRFSLKPGYYCVPNYNDTLFLNCKNRWTPSWHENFLE